MAAKKLESWHRPGSRRCCAFYLQIDDHLLCDKIPALIGFGGANTKYIYETTSTKVRIRGRKSGHKEEARCRCGIPYHKKKNGIYKDDALCTCKPTDACIMAEADIPLQMALSAEGPRRLAEALRMARALLHLHEVRYVVGEVRGPRDELDRLERMRIDGVVPEVDQPSKPRCGAAFLWSWCESWQSIQVCRSVQA